MTSEEKENQTKIKILVAEDNEMNLSMILDMLSIKGHDVIAARNGQEAVDLAIAHKPALIIMDISMPVMDGLEATRKLRDILAFAGTPIIALTANAEEVNRVNCFSAGCNEFLTKPIQTKELFDSLSRNLPQIN